MKKEKNSLFGDLFGNLTDEKLSGLGFSLALIVPTLLAVVAVVLLKLFNVSSSSDVYLYVNYTLTPLAFCLILLWTASLTKEKYSVRERIKANACSWKYYVLALTLQVGVLSLGTLNTAFLEFLSKFGYQDTPISLPSMDGFGFVGVLFVVAVLPAIFEELMFRGLILRGLKSFGTVGATLLCGLLFAFYHQNPAQTIYQFCCGAAFALMAIRADSVFPTMFSHFINNALVLVLTKLGIETYSTWIIIVCAVCLLGSLAWLLFGEKRDAKKSEDKTAKKDFFLYAAVGIAICAINWLATIFTGMGA